MSGTVSVLFIGENAKIPDNSNAELWAYKLARVFVNISM